MNVTESNGNGPRYYLTDLIGTKIVLHGKKIGRLADFVIMENDPVPEVTKLLVRRPFGEPSLLIPWEKVKVLKESEIVVSFENIKTYEGHPQPTDILLKDHILDKKVLDIEDREVEIVYDVKLSTKQNKLLVSDVNISRYRFFRRLGLKWLANFFYSLGGKVKDHKIPWRYIQPLPSDIGSFKGDVKLKVLKETLSEIHPADLADIIEELDSTQRVAIFNELESARASDTLEEIDPTVQRALVSAMKKERVAQLLSAMTPGQAADILSVLPMAETREILHVLRTLNLENAHKIESILGKQEERIANFATNKIIKLKQSTSSDEARDYFNRMAKYMDIIMYIYVIDDQERLVGVMDLKELLQAKPGQILKDVMIDSIIKLSPKSTLKDALEYFSRYEFRALPVTDEHHKIIGAVPFRDVMNLKHRFLE